MNFDFIFNLLFPPVCAACAGKTERDDPLCASCSSKLNFYRTFFCGRCGARLPEGKKVCHLDHPYILGAAMNYHEPQAEALIKSLKFGRSKKTAAFLAKILTNYASPLLSGQNFLIVPVPLGAKRLRERGFNQAGLIAECFAPYLNLPLEPSALRRVKETPPQSGVRGHRDRLNNVSGAFAAERDIVAGQNILLIDDVTTSGATFYEAALALKSAGAKKIIALAVAKA